MKFRPKHAGKIFLKIIKFVSQTVMALLLVFAGWMAYTMYHLYEPQVQAQFNRSVWQKQSGSLAHDNPRGAMTDDIKKRVIPSGMTKQDVVEILGVPDYRETEKCSYYHIGWWSGLRMDPDSLVVCFNDSGKKVETVDVVQH